MAKRKSPARSGSSSTSSARSSVSGPARKSGAGKLADALVAKVDATEALAAGMPYNANKEAEHGELAAEPPEGATVEPKDPSATGSTLSESNASNKAGKARL